MAPALVFAVALLVTALLVVGVSRSIAQRDRLAFEAEVERTTGAVRERIDTTITLLRGTAGLFAALQGQLNAAQFRTYVDQIRLRERYPGILGIGYSMRMTPGLGAREAARLRDDGSADFRVWPEGPRDEYHAIVYLEPLDERNRAALGYDMSTDGIRKVAMQRARDEGVPAASGKVVLVQEIDQEKQSGLLIYLPVYRRVTVPADVADRRRELQGFVYAPLRVGDLLQGVLGSGVRELDVEVYDGAEPQAGALMLSSRSGAQPGRFRVTRQLDVAGRPWLLLFSSRAEFDALSQRRLLPWLAVLSLAASLLLAWITHVQAQARRDAEQAADQRRRNALALQASEERALERAERLEQLHAGQREAERRKDEFLAVLAHELRNPLAPIRNALEMIRRAPGSPAAARGRDIAERQLHHMVRLIDDLLDVSRISRGKIVLQRQVMALGTVIEAAIETSRPLIESRGHRLEVGPVEPGLQIEADATRLAQILTNLLNNAAVYTPEGGLIRLSVMHAGDEVRIAVRDSGIGIPPGKLAHVFELFVQVGDAPGHHAGLGIGLNLAFRLAQLHGGRIEARSEGPGRGSEFVVVLPLAGAGAAAVEDGAIGPGGQAITS